MVSTTRFLRKPARLSINHHGEMDEDLAKNMDT